MPVFHDQTGRETFYILDFFCSEAKLAIEIDGKIHEFQKEKDKEKDEVITSMHIELIRFSNEDVEQTINKVLTVIKRKLDS